MGRKRSNNSSLIAEGAGQEVQHTETHSWVFSAAPSRNDLPIKDSSDEDCYFIGAPNCRYLLWP